MANSIALNFKAKHELQICYTYISHLLHEGEVNKIILLSGYQVHAIISI